METQEKKTKKSKEAGLTLKMSETTTIPIETLAKEYSRDKEKIITKRLRRSQELIDNIMLEIFSNTKDEDLIPLKEPIPLRIFRGGWLKNTICNTKFKFNNLTFYLCEQQVRSEEQEWVIEGGTKVEKYKFLIEEEETLKRYTPSLFNEIVKEEALVEN